MTNSKNNIAVIIVWWLFWLTIQIIVLHRLQLSWYFSFIDSLVTHIVLLLAGLATQNTYKFYQSGGGNRLYRFGWSFILSVITVFIQQYILSYLFNDNAAYIFFLQASLPLRFMYCMLMVAFATVVSWLLFYIQQQQEFQQRKNDEENLLRQAELSNLQLQMQPHFLFNSLNSISALAGSKPEEARKMIQQLSDFFRGTLKKDAQQLSTFENELTHLQLYLDIEKVRFGHRLNVILNCAQDTFGMSLPTLILQPIVENAIKFGLYDIIGNVAIHLISENINGQLCISVSNPFDAATAKPKQGLGFGLSAVQRRLYLLYAQNNLLITKQENQIFITQLNIPQHTK